MATKQRYEPATFEGTWQQVLGLVECGKRAEDRSRTEDGVVGGLEERHHLIPVRVEDDPVALVDRALDEGAEACERDDHALSALLGALESVGIVDVDVEEASGTDVLRGDAFVEFDAGLHRARE